VEFEYDPAKSLSNARKHGIDFEEAKGLWDDPRAVIGPAKPVGGELRFALLALREGEIWLAVYTLREGRVRLISVRRASDDERKLY
jgi:uncharacterized DUF497 family protein